MMIAYNLCDCNANCGNRAKGTLIYKSSISLYSFSHSSHIHTRYVLREAYFLTLFEKSLARMYMYHPSFTRGRSNATAFSLFTFHFPLSKKSPLGLF